jgi:hypothetical protein
MVMTPARTRKHIATDTTQADVRRPASGENGTAIWSIALFFALVMPVLFAGLFLRQPGGFEHQVVTMIQNIDLAYVVGAFGLVYSLTSFYFALAAWVILLIAAGLARKWGAAVATLIVPIAAAAAVTVDRVVSIWMVPDPALFERTIHSTAFPGFPSGQVVAAVLIYGILFFLARGINSRAVRLTIQSTSVLVVLMAGISQLWIGSLWPTEVFTAYAIAGLFLAPMLAIANRVDSACRDLPLVHAANVPDVESKPQAQALTSTVIFNESTVSKIYRPGFLPRAIYWLAFQAEFPYMRNQAALRAAVQRRNLIGLLTEYWYGSNHVARAIGIDQIAGRFAITSEYIEGTSPTDRDAARHFLEGLVAHFEAAGLPTWQIDPRQPRAMDNLLETADGRFSVVDLESGLVSPLASLRAWQRAFRRGLVPMYDDVFFDVTRSYVERHEEEMRAQKGDAWVRTLYSMLDATEVATQAWHDSEPRIWSRLLGRRRHRDETRSARQHWAIQWFEEAIENWHAEGRVDESDAEKLRQKVRSPQFVAVMPHFGVHLGTTLLLRFPLGSIARVGYSAFNLSLVTWRFVTRRIDRHAWREGVGIHSPLVILFAAVPGVGAFSYLASKPIRSDHLLLRVGLDAVLLKFPWRVYERCGLRWIVTQMPSAAHGAVQASGQGLRAVPPPHRRTPGDL